MRPRAGVRYTELAGRGLLYEPVTRSVHELSPSAAVIWHRLDGRTLGEAGDDEAPAIELVRRLRAIGLVEDGPPQPLDPAEPTHPLNARPGTTRWPGRLVIRGSGHALVIDGTPLADGDELGGASPLDEVVLVDPGAPDHQPTDASLGPPLAPLDALRAVVELLPAEWFGATDALDRVADLVELAPVRDGRDRGTSSDGPTISGA